MKNPSKTLIFSLLMLLMFTSSFSQISPDVYIINGNLMVKKGPHKQSTSKIPSIYGFVKIGLGYSPTKRVGLVETAFGIDVHKAIITAEFQPQIGHGDYWVFLGKIGYAFTMNEKFTFIPHVGYHTYWNGENKIKYTGGDRFLYGIEIDMITESPDLSVYASWSDLRPYTKTISIGIKKKFMKKKY